MASSFASSLMDSSTLAKYLGATAVLGVGLYTLARQTQRLHHHLEPSSSSSSSTPSAGKGTAYDPLSPTTTTAAASTRALATAAAATADGGHASAARVALQLSDAVFVFAAGEHLDLPALDEPARNRRGRTTLVRRMEARAGLGATITGALAASSQSNRYQQQAPSAGDDISLSALLPSSCLPMLIPSLYELVAKRSPCVFHVPTRSVDSELAVAMSVRDVLAVRDAGAVVLWSHTAQECHDMAVVAHHLAAQVALPVIHAYDGVRAATEHTPVQRAPEDALHDHFNLAKPAPAQSVAATVATAMEQLAPLLKPTASHRGGYRPFEYHGSPRASVVLVLMGVNTAALEPLLARHPDVGALVVRLYRPWSVEHFFHALPPTTRHLFVVEALAAPGRSPSPSHLFADVAAAFHSGHRSSSPGSTAAAPPALAAVSLVQGTAGLTPALAASLVTAVTSAANRSGPAGHLQVGGGSTPPTAEHAAAAAASVLAFVPSEAAGVVAGVTRALGHVCGLATQTCAAHDSVLDGGVARVEVLVDPQPITSHSGLTAAPFVLCASEGLLAADCHDLVASVAPKGTLVLLVPQETEIPSPLKHAIATRHITLVRLDPEQAALGHEVDEPLAIEGMAATLVAHAVSQALPSHRDAASHCAASFAAAHDPRLAPLARGLAARLAAVDFPAASWANERPDADEAGPRFTARLRLAAQQEATRPAVAPLDRHRISWNLMFQDAYNADQTALRPDVHETVHRVTLAKNQRLTPADYHRNIFHLEFDIEGTELTYEIGDALGVYGTNDGAEVRAFLERHSYDPAAFLSVLHKGGEEVMSLQQIFEQRLDLFGKPSQKFYDAIAPFAEDTYERLKLEWMGGEDKEGFQLRQLETYTFADVLDEFGSVRLPLTKLVELVPPIKPRHYSIASAFKRHPGSVHLLVVLVDWVTPKKRTRFGQCTRYLADLPTGSPVTVDIMPSILRLPQDPRQPVVMAGLGTGMAPFRAFIEERAQQRAAGIDVGPMVLYFGARYRAKEWLYGDELEEYERQGLVELRLAFSRDQDEKVYIQHKLLEDKERLYDLLVKQNGHFYLCGPTWPVPDVRQAIADGIKSVAGVSQEAADAVIDTMKDESRYVLEVY